MKKKHIVNRYPNSRQMCYLTVGLVCAINLELKITDNKAYTKPRPQLPLSSPWQLWLAALCKQSWLFLQTWGVSGSGQPIGIKWTPGSLWLPINELEGQGERQKPVGFPPPIQLRALSGCGFLTPRKPTADLFPQNTHSWLLGSHQEKLSDISLENIWKHIPQLSAELQLNTETHREGSVAGRGRFLLASSVWQLSICF